MHEQGVSNSQPILKCSKIETISLQENKNKSRFWESLDFSIFLYLLIICKLVEMEEGICLKVFFESAMQLTVFD